MGGVGRFLVAGALVGVIGSPALQPATTALADDQTATYVTDESLAFCAGCLVGGAPGAGGYRFDVNPGDKVTVTIADIVNSNVHGLGQFADSNGNTIGTLDLCAGKGSGVAPDNTKYLWVHTHLVGAQTGVHAGIGVPPSVSGTPNPSINCGSPNGAVEGTITVSGSTSGAAPAAETGRSKATARYFSGSETAVASGRIRATGPRGLRAL